jgi:protein ImuB
MAGHLFGALYVAESSAQDALLAVAREFSPRLAVPPLMNADRREVLLDLSGLSRLFGEGQTIAAELRRTAADRGLCVRVALAGTRTAARLLVRHRPGVTVIAAGGEAVAVGPLPVDALRIMHTADAREADDPAPLIGSLRRWGVRTLEQFAALPAADLSARAGQQAVRWQRVARGDDLDPLVPAVPEERFEQALDLEWPIEGLEPLSFVLGRLLEPLSAHLERRDRGAAVLHVRLHLVTREVHERSLQLPVAMREPRTLRTLLLLDLESHPPAAAIDRVVVAVDPTPGRIVQYSLLTRPLPTPEQLSTLIARLGALMGETRCGSPDVVDSWQPGAFAMKPFMPKEAAPNSALSFRSGDPEPQSSDEPRITDESRVRTPGPEPRAPSLALRRFRMPVIARVQVHDGQPIRVMTDPRGLAGGRVVTSAGPWRTSGGWWLERADRHAAVNAVKEDPRHGRPMIEPRTANPESRRAPIYWDRDEWDVALADGLTYRIFRERDSEKWFVEGLID